MTDRPLEQPPGTWHADSDSGMLHGWGHMPGAREDPAPAVPPTVLAEVLGGEAPLQTGTVEANPENTDDSPMERGEGNLNDGSEDDADDDDDDSVDVAELQALLRDNAAFFEACEEATLNAVGPSQPGEVQLRSAANLRVALSHICARCGIEEVDEEEADDLFDGPMDPGVFYQLAREYFSSLSRTLTMAV
mmetsp:Transcript_16166/g.33676  ORF Transcript_16166/g.33676 Transcript_16166/m.33676 type:complete len:191 (-) Transcript_16166:223-795(-)